jgi:D-3-phosphoglycerate dehydrogenase
MSAIRILVNDGIHPDGELLLNEAGFEVVTKKVEQSELASKLPHYDVLLVRSATKVRKDIIDACPRLKVIGRGGVGLDNIDVDHAKSKGIAIFNTPAASSQSVAELVFGHFMGLARSIHQSNREMPGKGQSDFKKLKKSFSKGMELRGKSLGIIGFGRIGREVARIGLGLGMGILPVYPFVDTAEIELSFYDQRDVSIKFNLETVSLESMLPKADFISVHVPGMSEPLITADTFNQMKKGVIIVNASRGGSIEEDALLAAIEEGKVAGAGLDVFKGEPVPRKELLDNPKISVTPHIGASTDEAQANIGRDLAQQIIGHFEKNGY